VKMLTVTYHLGARATVDEARSEMTNAEDGSYRLFVGGAWRAGSSAGQIEERSPIDDSVVGSVAAATLEDIEEALEAAAGAWPSWEEAGFSARADVLHATAELMRRNEDALTELLVNEIAKPNREARTCVQRTAGLIDYFAEEGRRFYGEIILGDSFPGYGRDKLCQVYREPQGVIVAISPFNYPLNLSASKLAPALITGNAVVFKPSIHGAMVALRMVELFRQAGLPAGVLNAVTGRSSEIGDALVAHPLVDMVAFTGSSSVGKHIALTAGMIPLMMELGGKDAALVLADADLDLAAAQIVRGAYSYAGQRCTAVKRVIVEQTVADPLVERLRAKTAEVKLGDPRDESVTMGPVISDEAAEFVQGLVDDAVGKGAQVLCGGKRDGRYIEPTLLDAASRCWSRGCIGHSCEPAGCMEPMHSHRGRERALCWSDSP